MTRLDPHSYADAAHPSIRHVDLEIVARFDERVLEVVATLDFDRSPDGVVDLDAKDLAIRSIVDDLGETVRFELGTDDAVLGRRLRLFTERPRVSLEYRTSPDASALQWLEPEQTATGRMPFLFTQCQAIHARTVLPCQDTPRVRFTYDARMTVPSGMRAVFAAAPTASDDVASVDARFSMPQPIPSYLLAFAAGDLQARDLSDRCRVWGEPPTLDVAAHDFAEVEKMIAAAEALFGPYAWDRFDLLVMPPSFPYGGMENPRLTFLTPTLLTGDRSLVNVVAHELAHAWTGNLVTNASAEHFWLNEGFTVHAERRIIEALEGAEAAALHAAIGRRELERDIDRLSKIDPELTALRTHLDGRDPDQVFSTVPYEKGYLFLRAIEAAVGRPAFDAFLQAYIDEHRFGSLTTEALVDFLDAKLPGARSKVDFDRWLFTAGLPHDAPREHSTTLDRLEALARRLGEGELPAGLDELGPTEWQVMLTSLPDDLPTDALRELEQRFGLSRSPNPEIRVEWLARAARRGDRSADAAIREMLVSQGRMKYLRPLYAGLLARGPEGRELAEDIFAEAHVRYHPVARAMVADLLGAGLS
jgi:aminopeptidase N